ncbi:MAG: hypothetical protein AB7J35_17055 [Dehalococcoidia bacterium]
MTRSHFSGTATFLELQVQSTDSGSAQPGPGEPVRAVIEPVAISFGGVPAELGFGGLSTPLGALGVMRLPPLSVGGDPVLQIRSIILFAAAESPPTTVNGDWSLKLDVPGDLGSRLHTEHLVGQSVDTSGVAVTVQGAVRSTSETLVTVRIDSANTVALVGEPKLVSDGRLLFGGLIASREDGRLLSFSFPPTKFGSAIQLSFGPFERKLDRTSGSVQIDIAAVMSRSSINGTSGEAAEILPTDVLRRDGVELVPKRLSFTWVNFNGVTSPAFVVTFDGAFPPLGGGEQSYSAVTMSGKSLDPATAGVGYSKDLAGVVCCPRTDMGFRYDEKDDLNTPISFTYNGDPSSVITGDWSVTLRP